MTENQTPIYPATVREDGYGVVPMIHESGTAPLPFDVVLNPEKVETWNGASDDARRASMAVVALHIAAIVQRSDYLGLPFPVEEDADIAAAYNFLMVSEHGFDGVDHVLVYNGEPRFSTTDLN